MTQLEVSSDSSPKAKPADSAAELEKTMSSNTSNASNASSPGGSETEKPVRRKLKRTQISQKEQKGDADTNGHTKEAEDDLPTTTVRGRRLRKRSHDDILEEDNQNATSPVTPSAGEHIRKKSRDLKTASQLKTSRESSPASVDEKAQNKRAKTASPKAKTASPKAKTGSPKAKASGKSAKDATVQRTPSLSPKQQERNKASPKRKREDDDNEVDAQETKEDGSEKRIIKNRRLSDEKKEKKILRRLSAEKKEEKLMDNVSAKTEAATLPEPVEQVVKTQTNEAISSNGISAQTEKGGVADVEANDMQASEPASESTNVASELVETVTEPKTDDPTAGNGVSTMTEKADVADVKENGMQAPAEFTETTKPQEPAVTESTTPADAAPAKPKFSFGNTSTMSPFGSLGVSKPAETEAKTEKEPATTSASAFASSGFAKLANSSSPFAGAGTTNVFGGSSSSASPFGGLASTSSSVFGGAAKDTTSTSTASPFAAAGGSVFGSGFSSGFGSGPKLTSFASPNVPPAGESEKKKQKAFGEPDSAGEEEDGEEGDEEEGEGETAEGEEGKQADTATENDGEEAPKKSGPKEVPVDTGEENEDIAIALNGKLFEFSFTTRKWAERGSGNLKINTRVEIGEDDKDKVCARIIMRSRATHKVILNAPMFKGMKATANGKQVTFSVPAEGGKVLVPHLFRMGNEENAKSLETVFDEIQLDL